MITFHEQSTDSYIVKKTVYWQGDKDKEYFLGIITKKLGFSPSGVSYSSDFDVTHSSLHAGELKQILEKVEMVQS